MTAYIRIGVGALIALLPSPLKIWFLRTFYRYNIGRNVHIGICLFADVRRCTLNDDVSIGHGNSFLNIDDLEIGEHSRIAHLNLFRGGQRIRLGKFVSVHHRNVLNSIIHPDAINPTSPECLIGDGAVITNSHWLDFTDRISIGPGAIIGGRASSLWTHSRQRTRPISIGDHTYIGSDVCMAPGTIVPENCIVALGAVLMDRFVEPRCLIAGNPARVTRPLREEDFPLVARATRRDMPPRLARATLPEDLHTWAG